MRARREALDYSREKLSFQADVSVSQLKRWETNSPGGRNPYLRDVLRVAVALGCESVEEIVEV